MWWPSRARVLASPRHGPCITLVSERAVRSRAISACWCSNVLGAGRSVEAVRAERGEALYCGTCGDTSRDRGLAPKGRAAATMARGLEELGDTFKAERAIAIVG